MFLGLTVRTVAVILPITLVLSDTFARRRLRLTVICIPPAAFGLLIALQRLVGLTGKSYSFITKYRFFTPVENIYQFYRAFTTPLAEAQVPGWVIALFLGLTVLAGGAVLYEAYKGAVLAMFLLSYTVMLLVLPDFNAGTRYLLPHLLVFGAFATRGGVIVSKILGYHQSALRAVAVGIAGGIVMVSLLVPSPLPSGHWNFGVTSASAGELFSFIRNNTPSEAVVAGAKHRGLHLFTGRTTIRLPMRPDHLAERLQDYNVSYVVIKHSEGKVKFDFTDCPESPFCHGDFVSLGVKRIFANSDFYVFAVGTSPEVPGQTSGEEGRK